MHLKFNAELNCYHYFSVSKPKDARDALLLTIKLVSYAILVIPLAIGVTYLITRLYNRRIRQILQKESKIPPFTLLNHDIQYAYLAKLQARPHQIQWDSTFLVIRDIDDYHITDEKILIGLAHLLIDRDSYSFARHGHQFKIQDPEAQAGLIEKLIQTKCRPSWEYLKKVAETKNKAILGRFAKVLAKEDSHEFCKNVHLFGIKDQHTLSEIAKLANSYDVIQNIEQFGFHNQSVLQELAQHCIINSYHSFFENFSKFPFSDSIKVDVIKYALIKHRYNHEPICKNLNQFKITDQKCLNEIVEQIRWDLSTMMYLEKFNLGGEESLMTLIQIAAKKYPDEICTNFCELAIKEEKQRVTIAKFLCRSSLGQYVLGKNIQKFNIKDQKSLVEIAKLCGMYISEHIQNFGIKDEADRFEIAKIAIAIGYGASRYIENYGISNQQYKVELFHLAKKHDTAFPECVNEFGIEDKKLLNAAAEELVKLKRPISRYIKNFKVDDQILLVKLAKELVKYDQEFVYYKCYFDIQKVAVLHELIFTAAENRLPDVSQNIKNYKVKNNDQRIKIARLAALYDENFARYLGQYNIQNKKVLAELAEVAVANRLPNVSEYIRNFKIEDSTKLMSLAQKLALYDVRFVEFVNQFKIQDQNILLELAKANFSLQIHSFNYFSQHFKNFNLSQEYILEIYLNAVADKPRYLTSFIQSINLDPKTLPRFNCLEKIYETTSEEGKRQLDPWLQFVTVSYLNDKKEIVFSDVIQKQIQLFEEAYQTIAHLHLPDMRYKLAFLVFTTFKSQNRIENYKEFLKNTKHPLIALLLTELSIKVPESKDRLDRLATVCDKRKRHLKEHKYLSAILHTLFLMIKQKELSPIEFIIKAMGQEREKGRQELLAIQGIIQADANELFSQKEKSIQELYLAAFKKLIPLDSTENFFERYMQTIGKEPDAISLLVYAGRMKSLNEPLKKNVLDLLSIFVNAILNDTYAAIRKKKNKHTELLFKARPELEKEWMRGGKQSFLINTSKNSIDYREKFKFALQHKHLEAAPELEQYLNFPEIKIKDKLLKTKDLAKNEIQLLAIELIENGDDTNKQLEKLFRISSLLQGLTDSKEFSNDIQALINAINKHAIEGKVTLHDTDDAWQMFMSGTRVEGSCQRVDGTPRLNKCLISLPLDPKRRLLYVEKKDQMIARTVVRLLLNKYKEPVLMQERIYPDTAPDEIKKALLQFAKQRAKSLGVRLYQAGNEISCSLSSFYSPGPEYVDSHQDEAIQETGVYTISSATLIRGNTPLETIVKKVLKRNRLKFRALH